MSTRRATMSRRSRHLWTIGLAAALVTLCLALPARTSAQSAPDLVVRSVTLSPAAARAGDAVTALVTVRNAGGRPAEPSTVDLYLARTPNASPDSATALGTVVVEALAPGASIGLPLTFTVPQLPRGRVYVIALADASGSLAEAYEGNNRAARVLEVTSPDVVVSAISLSPRVARAGDTVNAAVTVRNIGRVPADASSIGLFLVGTAGPLEGGTELGVQALDPLAPGASVQISLTFTVPAVAPASFYVLARADVTGAMAETSELNNHRTAFFQVALPDLVVDSLAVGPSTTRAGDEVTIRVRVRNQGPVPAEASEGAVYFVSSTASALEGATPLLGFPVTRLMPGTSAETTLSLPVPSATAGAYSVVARADSTGLVAEGSEANNARRTDLRVATPNLVIAGFTATPGTVAVGETIRGIVSIHNRGAVSSYPTSASLYVATSPDADLVTAYQMVTVPVPAVPAYRLTTLTVPVVVPSLPSGAHYLIVEADEASAQRAPSGALTESPALILASISASRTATTSTTTTAVSTQPRRASRFQVAYPDLVVSALSVGPTRARPGETVTVSVTVSNQGQVDAGPTTAVFHLGADAGAPTQELTLLGTAPVGPLRRGSSATIRTSLLVPDITAGSYHFVAQADFPAEVPESNEANNRRTMPLVVEGSGSDPVDTRPDWAANPYGILVSGMDHNTARSDIARLMQIAKEAGAGWIRTDFWWYSVEWFRGQWNWRFFDTVVEEAEIRGLKVIPILQGTPLWAATDRVISYGVPDMAAWDTFVTRTVERYRGRISAWEIWNEPDTTFYWKGTPAQYAELLARAHTAIKSMDPTAMVWLGGLAQGGVYMTPNFLQRILADARHPAGSHFDVHNVHTNFRSMAGIVDQIEANLEVLRSFGVPKPLVVTEASYTSAPEYQWVPGYQGGKKVRRVISWTPTEQCSAPESRSRSGPISGTTRVTASTGAAASCASTSPGSRRSWPSRNSLKASTN